MFLAEKGHSPVKLHGSTQAANHSPLSLSVANQILPPHPLFGLHSSNHSLGSFHLSQRSIGFSSLFFTHITHHLHTSIYFHPTPKKRHTL